MHTVEQSRTAGTEAAKIMPFGGWETTPLDAGRGASDALFRFPAADDPSPSTARLLAMSLLAAALGLTGVGVGGCGLLTVLGGAAWWFMPALWLLGLSSVAGAVGAFLSIHRPTLPWLLLAGSAMPMAGAALLAVLY